jgi:hypothetical protein
VVYGEAGSMSLASSDGVAGRIMAGSPQTERNEYARPR